MVYLHKGGRCSLLSFMGATVMNIRPRIVVKDGAMQADMKYRGNPKKCLTNYIRDKLKNRDDIDTSALFITHTGVGDEVMAAVHREIDRHARFENIYDVTAGSTIACHCRPKTLGILFIGK